MNVKFHKMTSYTLNIQNFTCVFIINLFLRNLTFVFSDSHEKLSLVLLQMTNYIFNP